MLFSLGEYNRAAMLRFHVAMEEQVLFTEPSLRAFRVMEVEALSTAQVPIDGGRTVELAPGHLQRTIRFDPERIVAGEMAAVHETLLAEARQLASARLAYMKRSLDTVTQATGQVARVGRAMTWEDVMAAIEKLEIKFDAHGQPSFKFWPPTANEAYEALPPRNQHQEQRWQQLMTTKREEANARKRHRRLR